MSPKDKKGKKGQGQPKAKKQVKLATIAKAVQALRSAKVGRNKNPAKAGKGGSRKGALSLSQSQRMARTMSDPGTVMMNFLAPCNAKSFRWPFNGATPETEMTACSCLHEVLTVNTGAGLFSGTYLDSTTSWVGFLFRQPLRNLVYLVKTATGFDYTASFNNGGTAATTWIPAASQTTPFPTSYLSCVPSSGTPPHGPSDQGTYYLYCGSLSDTPDLNFIWLGVGDVLTFTTVGTAADVLSFVRLINPGSRDPILSKTVQTTVTTTSTTFTATASGTNMFGYWAVSVTASATPNTYSQKLTVSPGDVLAHHSASNAATKSAWFRSIRVNSTALLVSNIASEYYKEGSMYAALISDETPFTSMRTTDSITTRARYYDGKAANGCYGWLPPIGDGSMVRRCALQSTGNIITASNFYLDDGVGYEVFRVDTAAASSSADPALDFKLTLNTAVEYSSTDQWSELEFSTVDCVTALNCLQISARADVFAENPLHMRDLVSFVGRAATFVRKHSGYLAGILSAAFPAFSSPITAIGAALGQ